MGVLLFLLIVIVGIAVLYLSLKKDKKNDEKFDLSSCCQDITEEFLNIDIKKENIKKLQEKVSEYVLGQKNLINAIIISLLANDHILVEGYPGVAKTRTILVFSKLLGLDFARIQFTPDMLPSDIIGAEIFNKITGKFEIYKGPIFTNLLLADEINRATPKVQSALLEAMQEGKVTIGNNTFDLPKPFFVMATQNPIEQEGTFVLPEAQLDRFLMKLEVNYPTKDVEKKLLDLDVEKLDLDQLISKEELLQYQKEIKEITLSEKAKNYIVDIIEKLRQKDRDIVLGPSPRASLALKKVACALAYLQDKQEADIEDVKKAVLPVLRHRVKLSYQAISEGKIQDAVILKKIYSLSDI